MSSGNCNKKQSYNSSSGLHNERILVLVFGYLNWDIPALCIAACVNRRLRALANRLLWHELCLRRAPRLMSQLGSSSSKVSGGWHALGKLLFFCDGCGSTPGHFTGSNRFSKTSGRSFLAKSCKGDVLYVSDPCEHPVREGERCDMVGSYRGVFRKFRKSRTMDYLVRRSVELEVEHRCRYCRARVWSMAAARMIQRERAATRLGAANVDAIEYFVCLNGHLTGTCLLVPLTSDEAGDGTSGSEERGVNKDDDDV